ncbi:protein G12 [Monomorium pharaonis]|uniref:protein G12 n=1 Tax=Monomorium pharaonis TaxID=307658 RepID=UPI0017478D82|nr:protein G12 [Monomorium pharaonis]
MKFTLGLVAVLAVVGLGQAYPFLDYGKNLAIDIGQNSAIQFGKNNDLIAELVDFLNLIPAEEFVNIIVKYFNEDEKVQEAIEFLFTNEFHDLLRALEALKEHQAWVVFLEKAGLPIIQAMQEFHRVIGMEDYVPPKIEALSKSLIKTQKIGDGIDGMLKDLYDILPLDKIDALYEEKMRTSKVYADFVTKITSKEAGKIVHDIGITETYKEFNTKTKERGIDFEKLAIFNSRVIGIKIEN